MQTGPIGAGQTRAYTLSYQPAFVGPLETAVALHFTDGQLPPQHQHDVVFKLAAIGVGAQAKLRPRSVEFEPTPVGAVSSPRTVEVNNIGLRPLSVAFDIIGGDYRMVTGSPTTIGGGQTATVAIAFQPQGVGPRESTYTISSDSLYPPMPVSLHGEGIAAPLLRAAPDRFAFPNTVVGSRRTATIVIENPGAVDVTTGTVSLVPRRGSGFAIRGQGCANKTLGVGQSCTISIVFSPTASGDAEAQLRIAGPAQPLEVTLSGHASPASGLVPNESEVDFGEVRLGESSPSRSVRFTNAATTPASVTDVRLTGLDASDLTIFDTTCTGALLQPGDACVVQVQFAPTAIGTKSAWITANADVVGHPALLHGVGTGGELVWSQNGLDFGNMNIGVQTPAQTVEPATRETPPWQSKPSTSPATTTTSSSRS